MLILGFRQIGFDETNQMKRCVSVSSIGNCRERLPHPWVHDPDRVVVAWNRDLVVFVRRAVRIVRRAVRM